MCAKNDLIKQKSPLLTSTQTSNHVDTFSLDFAFSFAITILIRLLIARGNVSNANILLLIAFIISYYLFADKLVYALNRATVVLIIILRLIPSTLLARFIPITKIRNSLLKTLENAAKSRILLALLLTSIKKNRYCTRYTKHYNFNIYVSLATDTLHLLLKGLVIKMLDFMQDMLDDIYPSTVVSPLFISKAPFALHFIHAVCDLVILAQYKSYNEDTLAYIQEALERINVFKEEFRVALDSICTKANSKAHYITIVKQFYSITNKKEDNRRQSRTVTDDRKHIAYIRAFSKVLLFNNNRQIDNTTRMLSTLQAFKFYDLSTIICLVHLVLRDLPNLTTRTTISYYVNNYIN
ncbi:hypothetical protein HBI57_068320 [Parastagonospora nodorum]|nr:hypothetical protein HBI57_068320 [Parastagonospora nodorum]KAH6504046.1 hypothetical protein HBI58_024070 [Parastagonospora nodorum]